MQRPLPETHPHRKGHADSCSPSQTTPTAFLRVCSERALRRLITSRANSLAFVFALLHPADLLRVQIVDCCVEAEYRLKGLALDNARFKHGNAVFHKLAFCCRHATGANGRIHSGE